MPFDLGDYVDVAERIAEFRVKHPEGSLQSEVLRWPDEGFPFVAVQATAFRSPTDLTPGKGLAWENFPGRTPYTKDSELQNAETSAWGRAIVAALAADTKRGVASRQEVSRASGGSSSGESATASVTSSQQGTPPEPTSAYGEGAAETDPGGQDAGSDTAPQGTVDPDALASEHTWAEVLNKGVRASGALKIARKLWPDAGIRSSTELTNRQLGEVLVAYVGGERG